MRSAVETYQRMIGQPAAQLIGGGVRGFLGLNVPSYATDLGREAYRTGQAMGNMPGIGAPAGAFKAAAMGAQALPAVAGEIGRIVSAMPTPRQAAALQAEDFLRYQRSIPPGDISNVQPFKRASVSEFDPGSKILNIDLYHGSNQIVNEVNPRFFGSHTGTPDASEAFWLTDSAADARNYAQWATEKFGGEEVINRFIANVKKPLVIGTRDENSSVRGKMREKLLENKEAAFSYAKKHGYDSVVWPQGNANDSGFTAAIFEPKSLEFVEAF
jgi:hypothetical protein